jgi:iron(III) transport system ATP-binding protein
MSLVTPTRAISPAEVSISNLTVSHGDREVLSNVGLNVKSGEMLSLLGPSGCGKTTLLRAVAGLHNPDTGVITIGSQIVSGNRKSVPPEHRKVGMVFQDGALFPHLTVGGNVGFGLKGQPDRLERISDVLQLVGMEEFADRLPGTLSGGQQQRVALARALAPEPAVLLLDEPFSALDAGMRVDIRRDVKRILSEIGVTVILVTHDQEEAFVMGDRVAVMRDGQISQVGTPADLYENPINPWVAKFVGDANLVSGRPSGNFVSTSLGELPVRFTVGSEVSTVLLRPEQLSLVSGDQATVESVEYYGHDASFNVITDHGEQLEVRMVIPRFAAGDRVGVEFVGTAVLAWPQM